MVFCSSEPEEKPKTVSVKPRVTSTLLKCFHVSCVFPSPIMSSYRRPQFCKSLTLEPNSPPGNMCGHLTGFNSSWPHKEGFCTFEIKDEETHFNLQWVVIRTIVSCFLEKTSSGENSRCPQNKLDPTEKICRPNAPASVMGGHVSFSFCKSHVDT